MLIGKGAVLAAVEHGAGGLLAHTLYEARRRIDRHIIRILEKPCILGDKGRPDGSRQNAIDCLVVDLFRSATIVEFAPLTPLFEKEWHASGIALVAKVAGPVGMHRPRAWAALTAANHPIDHYLAIIAARKFAGASDINWTEEGLTRKKLHRRRYFA